MAGCIGLMTLCIITGDLLVAVLSADIARQTARYMAGEEGEKEEHRLMSHRLERCPKDVAYLIRQCLDFCDQMIHLAEKGMSKCDEEARMLFFGIILDSAYKLKAAGEIQRQDLSASNEGSPQDKPVSGYSKAYPVN